MKWFKKFKAKAILFVIFLVCTIHISHAQQTKDISASISTGIYNQYIFRGYEIGKDGIVIQPSIGVSYKGFSASIWGNIDTNQRNTKTATFTNEFKKGLNETDLTLSYTHNINALAITGGYIYYGTKYADETEEVFISFALDVLGKPALSIYRDITNCKGTYINLGFSHAFPLYKRTTLDLSGFFGYFAGEGDYWRTYERSTGAYTGKKYRGFHDGMVRAGITIPATRSFSIQPSIQYWFPLSSDAEKEYPTAGDIKDSYNPNGPVKYNLVYGVNLTYNF